MPLTKFKTLHCLTCIGVLNFLNLQNMKNLKLIYIVLSALFLFNCSDDQINVENQDQRISSNDNTNSKRILGTENKEMGYQGQLPYAVTSSDNGSDLLQFLMENNIHKNIENRNVDWSFFDQLYSENLNVGQKQYLAYLVLTKKDLLKDFDDNPNKMKAEKIKFYTDILVNSDYTGYCLLYNCMKRLKLQNYVSNDIANMKISVVQNYKKQKFSHDETVKNFQINRSDETDFFLEKLQDNLRYIKNINDL